MGANATVLFMIILSSALLMKLTNGNVLGADCEKFEHCAAIQNAKCSENNTCVCKHDTVEWNENICLKKTIPADPSYEFIDQYSCEAGKCTLKPSYVSQSGRKRESTSMYGEQCTSRNDCKRYGFEYINCINHECKCPINRQFVHLSKSCQFSIKGTGRKCATGYKCDDRLARCNAHGICRCKSSTYYNSLDSCEEDPHVCKMGYYDSFWDSCSSYATAINEYCGEEKGCKDLPNTECKDRKCQCMKNHFIEDNKCKPLVGAACDRLKPCTIDNSECKGDKCVCSKDYDPSRDRKMCLKMAEAIGDWCELKETCSKLPNSLCLDSHCECDSADFHKGKDGKSCYRKAIAIGGKCESDDSCSKLEHSSCDGGTCKCPAMDFDPSINKTRCYLKATEVEHACETDEFCSKVRGSHCSTDSKCECDLETDMAKNKTMCIKKATALDDFCDEDKTCSELPDSVCIGNKCACNLMDFDYSLDKKKCLRKAAVKLLCKNNYQPKNGICYGTFGADCTKDSDCIENLRCFGRCGCEEYTYFSLVKNECLRFIPIIKNVSSWFKKYHAMKNLFIDLWKG